MSAPPIRITTDAVDALASVNSRALIAEVGFDAFDLYASPELRAAIAREGGEIESPSEVIVRLVVSGRIPWQEPPDDEQGGAISIG